MRIAATSYMPKTNTSKLTLKQKRFVAAYVKSGNATAAARLAGYKDKDPTGHNTSIRAIASELLTNPNVLNAIEQALAKVEVTPEWIVNELKKIAVSSIDKSADRMRALENLAKIIELTGFKQQTQSLGTTINGDITISFGKPQMALPSHSIDTSTIIEGELV